jgi:hypothetical protein
MDSTARKKIESQIRRAVDMIHTRIKVAALGMQEAQTYWRRIRGVRQDFGRDDRYFEGFEHGLNAAKLHIEDAMQAFVDGELVEEVLGDA